MLLAIIHLVTGTSFELPESVVRRFPELRRARWRCGGLAVRIGGWMLGRQSVSGITLWSTIYLSAPARATLDVELLLHELRHVDQFEADPLFPLRYLWKSVRRGYWDNPYEADARIFAATRLAGDLPTA